MAPSPSPRPPRVLVVDDYLDVADSLAHLLRLFGCEARTHPDGRGVPDLARQFAADAVILDIQLPGSSGVDIAVELAALSPRPRVAIHTGFGHRLDLPPGVVEAVFYKLQEPQALIDWVLAAPPAD